METTGLYPSTSLDLMNLRTRPLAIKERLKWTSVPQSSSLPYCSIPPSAECRTEDITLCYASTSCADITACTSEAVLSLSRSFYHKTKFPPVEAVSKSILEMVPKQSALRLLTPMDSKAFSYLEPQNDQTYLPHILSFVSTLEPAIGSYDLLGNLGDGTHGEVMLASLKGAKNGELFAIKILRKTSNEIEKRGHFQETSTLQMILEASGLPRAQSTGVQFLQKLRSSFFNEEHVQCLVLEYHPLTLSNPQVASCFLLTPDFHARMPVSPSLPVAFDKYLAPQRPQGEILQSVRLLAAEISLGLAFLHNRGLIHQDIKPANIFISYAGHIVIGDFGATSRMPFVSGAQDAFGNKTTGYGTIVLHSDDFITFTPIYAAPELKERTPEGLIVYNNRSDWWSLGILLYEMVTGTLPFLEASIHGYIYGERRSDGDHSLTFGALKVFSDRLKRRNRAWVPGLESFLLSLLLHDPEDRLTWPDIKDHEFLYPLRELWDEIADLRHPPCSDLAISRVYDEHSCQGKVDTDTDLVCRAESIFPSLMEAQDIEHYEVSNSLDCVLNPSSQIFDMRRRCDPHPTSVSFHDDSDRGSIPQAWPSSASIWNFSDIRQQIADSVSDVIDSYNARYHISGPSIGLRSPFSSTPVLHSECQQSISVDVQRSLTLHQAEPLGRYDNPIDPEELTWSLLEAMDERDLLFSAAPQRSVRTRKQSYLGILKRFFHLVK